MKNVAMEGYAYIIIYLFSHSLKVITGSVAEKDKVKGKAPEKKKTA